MADFSKSPGPFVDRDLYVVVDAMDGLVLAHINPKILGRNMIDLRDADGRYQIRERLDAARGGVSGWQDFKFFNPVTRKVEPKRTYWEKHDNLVFACGAYKAE
jgi:signal transduction histidine kinase